MDRPLKDFYKYQELSRKEGVQGFHSNVFNHLDEYPKNPHASFGDVTSENNPLSATERITAMFKMLPQLARTDVRHQQEGRPFSGTPYAINTNPSTRHTYYSERRRTDIQPWYLTEHYYSNSQSTGRTPSLCSLQDKAAVQGNDIVKILIPSVCSVWDAMMDESATPFSENKLHGLRTSLPSADYVFLMSNVPKYLSKLSYSAYDGIWSVHSDNILRVPERANIAYVTIPYEVPLDRTNIHYQATNMVRLWRSAVREIRGEANRLHDKDGGDSKTNRPHVIVTVPWHCEPTFENHAHSSKKSAAVELPKDLLFKGQTCQTDKWTLALKIAAIRLAGCVDEIQLVSLLREGQLAEATNFFHKNFKEAIQNVDLEAGFGQY